MVSRLARNFKCVSLHSNFEDKYERSVASERDVKCSSLEDKNYTTNSCKMGNDSQDFTWMELMNWMKKAGRKD